MDWFKVAKTDVPEHVLPEDRRQDFIKYQGKNSTWVKAEFSRYIKNMDKYNIKKAILVPTNAPYMYYSTRETNEFVVSIVENHPDRFIGFADLNFNGSDIYILVKEVEELEYTVKS